MEQEEEEEPEEDDPSDDTPKESSPAEVEPRTRSAVPPPSIPKEDDLDIEDPQSILRLFHFVIALGQAAYLYGSFGSTIESCLVTLLESVGYTGLFRVTQSEIMAKMQMSSDSVPVFCMVHATKSMNLISLDFWQLLLKMELRKNLHQKRAWRKSSKLMKQNIHLDTSHRCLASSW